MHHAECRVFFLGRNFVTDLICTLKPKNFFKKTGCFKPWSYGRVMGRMSDAMINRSRPQGFNINITLLHCLCDNCEHMLCS